MVIFGAALLLPFPKGKTYPAEADLPAGTDPGTLAGSPGRRAAADLGEDEDSGMWTSRLRRGALRLLPPGKLLPDRQPAYVASWIYVFGVAAVAAMEAGWVVTEVGRQPWIVYRVMLVSDAVTPSRGVPVTLGVILALYAILTVVSIGVPMIMSRRWRQEPPAEEEAEQVPYGPPPARASPAGPPARPAVPPASSGGPGGP